MRNIIIVLWITLIGFFAAPIAVNYVSGIPHQEVESVIERESEADNIIITADEEHGNKAMYCFNIKSDFGVAVFSHYGDKYSYVEGTLANGGDAMTVRLDTGRDLYIYDVNETGAKLIEIQRFGGTYKIYAMTALAMAVITVIYIIYRLSVRNRKPKESINCLK